MSERLLNWLWRGTQWLLHRVQPTRGWLVFVLCLLLALLPALGGNARWREAARGLWLVGPLAVVAVWLLPTKARRHAAWQRLLAVAWLALAGIAVIAQMLVGWLPSPLALFRAAQAGAWAALAQSLAADWLSLAARFSLWSQGVQSGDATQDPWIVAAWMGLALWAAAVITAWLIKRPLARPDALRRDADRTLRVPAEPTAQLSSSAESNHTAVEDAPTASRDAFGAVRRRGASGGHPHAERGDERDERDEQGEPSGLLAALPLLALTVALYLYGDGTRSLLVTTLTLVLALHAALDQRRRWRAWAQLGWPHSSGLGLDRAAAAAAVATPLLLLALIVPNLRVQPLASRYFQLTEPLRAPVVQLSERAFPDLQRSYGLGGSGVGGLPNAFLIDGAPNLREREVLRIRTDETVLEPMDAPDEFGIASVAPPLGHYLRGGTLAVYTGRGWQNPAARTRERQPGDATFVAEALPAGRRLLTQNIVTQIDARVLYAAPEPVAASVAYEADWRAQSVAENAAALGDLVTLRPNQPGQARSYTVVSAIPDVDAADLADVPPWNAEELSPALAVHLDLPPEVSDRTRQLAAEITEGLATPYEQARAIEQYLRRYPYDLEVPAPPENVEIADYFLFDLERGYCDYYATAFAVLARLNGLPTRFATGFAVGTWNPDLEARVVTEAEAHSWPEVYFPAYGWVAFEPTAGRPELARVDTTPEQQAGQVESTEPTAFAPLPPLSESWWARWRGNLERIDWNWQMGLWLLPLAGLAWGAVMLLDRYAPGWRALGGALLRSPRWWGVLRARDPWTGLLRWGRVVGRPLRAEETVLEYGAGLAEHVRATEPMERGRLASGEVRTLSRAISDSRYATADRRDEAAARAVDDWSRLRSRLRSRLGRGM